MMALYTIDIDDSAVTGQIDKIINDIFIHEIRRKYTATGDVIAVAVKELVYSHKDEIIDKVVDRAVKEIVRKGLPKLLERCADNGKA